MKILYLDCDAGAAGDMVVAALLDAGARPDIVRSSIAALALPGAKIAMQEVTRADIRALHFVVDAPEETTARHLSDIEALLDSSSLSPEVRALALETFRTLATAEARVHAADPENVHFHEVGAADALVDVVAACAAFVDLAPDRTIASAIGVGRGEITTLHGPMSAPAPAVLELLKGAPIVERWDHESVTPTGAALVRTFADAFGPIPEMILSATGYGAGTRNTAHPNVVRALVGESLAEVQVETAVVIETNIDDMSPELFPYVIEALLAAGAHDAWTTPITMKKGRHGVSLGVLAAPDDVDRLSDIIFRETTTLGVRKSTVTKDALARMWVEVEVDGIPIRVKIGRRAGAVTTVSPEYEDAAATARTTGRPLHEIYSAARSAALELLGTVPR
ncbi:MAG TPA: nickel pincer cofactor biosynthesis protein LarC [Actinomycetota bacterium]|nr:nickel pincer cofactor biosynthesis protein LarC [Actinomycetota bacterium]